MVRRSIKDFAIQTGFQHQLLGEVDLIIAELLSNAIKYAGAKCTFLIKQIRMHDTPGLEIIYLDKGPGMNDPTQMLKAGISTANTLGHGLGVAFNSSDYFDMYTRPQKGTAILSRKFLRPIAGLHNREEIDVGGIGVAMAGESYCGDSYAAIINGKKLSLIMSDGLGHGHKAHLASSEAISSFQRTQGTEIVSQLREMHQDLKSTRGAVSCICQADLQTSVVSACGIGNISAKVVAADGQVSNCRNFNGIVGYTIPNTLSEEDVQWEDGAVLIAHSDGIKARWRLSDYVGIVNHDPTLISAVLYRDFYRERDDAAVIAVKRQSKPFYPYGFMLENGQYNTSVRY